MDLTPMLVVKDVAASSEWYRQLLELESAHGGDEFEMLMSEKGELLLMLHHPELEEHPGLETPGQASAGAGVLLYFSVSNLNDVFARAQDMSVEVLTEPEYNPKAHAVEFTARDPDGYLLAVSEQRRSDADDSGEA